MTRFSHTRTTLLSLLCVGGVVVAPLSAENEAANELTIQEWSRLVWESASSGDVDSLNAYFDAIPDARENKQNNNARDGLRCCAFLPGR